MRKINLLISTALIILLLLSAATPAMAAQDKLVASSVVPGANIIVNAAHVIGSSRQLDALLTVKEITLNNPKMPSTDIDKVISLATDKLCGNIDNLNEQVLAEFPKMTSEQKKSTLAFYQKLLLNLEDFIERAQRLKLEEGIPNKLKTTHDTAKAIIRNIKA